jgi:hypothetical protein
MKFVAPRRYADPEAAAKKLMEIANSVAGAGRPHPYRVDQLAVPAGASRQPGRVQGRSRLRDRTRLAVAPRERHLCEVHPDRLRAVRMTIVLAQSLLLVFPGSNPVEPKRIPRAPQRGKEYPPFAAGSCLARSYARAFRTRPIESGPIAASSILHRPRRQINRP